MKAPVVVIGGGPAGMCAALAAAEHGAHCCIVDEGFDLGGQIYRRPLRERLRPAARGEALRGRIVAFADRIEVRRGAAVWGVFPGPRVAIESDGLIEELEPEQVVLAPGAYEYVPPFPGWTLPGVLTPGAAQIFAKGMGVAPGERVLIAGSGPFLLSVAVALVRTGIEVAGVVEAASWAEWRRVARAGWRTPGLLAEGLGYLTTLRRVGVPIHYGSVVVRAHGEAHVEAVDFAPADADWRPDRTHTRTERVDTLCVGYGFVPRALLARQAGCALEYRGDLGGWVPERDANLETSVRGIFAAGDGAGVAGSQVAEVEGRIAGLAVATRLDLLHRSDFLRQRGDLTRDLVRMAPLRAALDRISMPRPGLEELVEDDTIVCRCEELRWNEVRESIEHGSARFEALKVTTRLGMGACQGRSCWPAMARQAARAHDLSLQEVGPSSARPPLRPLPFDALAAKKPVPA